MARFPSQMDTPAHYVTVETVELGLPIHTLTVKPGLAYEVLHLLPKPYRYSMFYARNTEQFLNGLAWPLSFLVTNNEVETVLGFHDEIFDMVRESEPEEIARNLARQIGGVVLV